MQKLVKLPLDYSLQTELFNLHEQRKEKRYKLESRNKKEFDKITSRLGKEIQKLRKSANVNLAIGLTIFFGALFLGYEVLNTAPQVENDFKLIYYFIPRLSFVICCDFFGYFFLKLYKSDRNKITTIEMKIAAINMAIDIGNENDISTIISDLSKTERNFILNKGESSVEKNKMENFKDIFKFITDILNKRP